MKSKKQEVLSQTQKNRILSVTRSGKKAPLTWKLIHSEECNENEMDFNSDLLIKKLSAKFNFLVTTVSNPDKASALDSGNVRVRYRYILKAGASGGILKTNSRDFCRTLIAKNLLYRIEDINTMSFRGANPLAKRNYSIFRYGGAWNCRHKWQRETYVVREDNK